MASRGRVDMVINGALSRLRGSCVAAADNASDRHGGRHLRERPFGCSRSSSRALACNRLLTVGRERKVPPPRRRFREAGAGGF